MIAFIVGAVVGYFARPYIEEYVVPYVKAFFVKK